MNRADLRCGFAGGAGTGGDWPETGAAAVRLSGAMGGFGAARELPDFGGALGAEARADAAEASGFAAADPGAVASGGGTASGADRPPDTRPAMKRCSQRGQLTALPAILSGNVTLCWHWGHSTCMGIFCGLTFLFVQASRLP